MKASKEQSNKQRKKEQTKLIAETIEQKRKNDHPKRKATTKHDNICKIQDTKYGAASKAVRRERWKVSESKKGALYEKLHSD